MKKILFIVMVCCIVTATAVFASTQTNLIHELCIIRLLRNVYVQQGWNEKEKQDVI